MEGWEKILPNQAFNSNLWLAKNGPFERAIYERILDVSGVGAPMDTFRLETSDRFTIEQMASSPVTLAFLQWLVRATGARSLLEIGAFVGVSAMYLASAMPAGGRLTSVEKFDEFAAIARRNFEKNGLAGAIELVVADAAVAIQDLAKTRTFDFVFVDGNKENYAGYVDAVAPCVTPGGLIVVDDAFFHGDALLAEPATEKGRGVKRALDRAKSMAGWDRTLLPISNGILVLRKHG